MPPEEREMEPEEVYATWREMKEMFQISHASKVVF